MKRFLILFAAILLVSNTAFAATEFLPLAHYVNGVSVSFAETVATTNPFEYKVVITNDTNSDKSVEIREMVPNFCTIESANHPFDLIGSGSHHRYQFLDVFVPQGGNTELIMTIQNNSPEDKEFASINTQWRETGAPNFWSSTLFLFIAQVPAIPEFEFLLIPLGIVLASFYLIQRKKK